MAKNDSPSLVAFSNGNAQSPNRASSGVRQSTAGSTSQTERAPHQHIPVRGSYSTDDWKRDPWARLPQR